MVDDFDPDFSRRELLKSSKVASIHWVVIVASFILTFSAWYFSNKTIQERHQIRFERYSEQIASQVTERMDLYKNALQGGVAFIETLPVKVTPEIWRTYNQRLNIVHSFPGIHGLGVIYHVDEKDEIDFINSVKIQRPSFKIFPAHNESELWPITFIEPIETNEKALGLDMAFESNRYLALKKARDLAEPQITGPIELVQYSKKSPGFLFYVPFYDSSMPRDTIEQKRASIIGVVYAPFIMEHLMKGTLSSEHRLVNVRIYDEDTVIYDGSSNSRFETSAESSSLKRTSVIQMFGRNWQFEFEPTEEFIGSVSYIESRLILFGGIFIDFLIIFIIFSVTYANKRALKHADRVTKMLKQETSELERINKDLEQFNYVASHDLKSPLNAIKQLVTWISEDCSTILPNDSKKHFKLLKQRTQRMESLLNDLLEYSRLSNLKASYQPINLKILIADISFLLDIPKTFSIVVDDKTVWVTPEAIEIVLRNLILNSIKHHHTGSGKIHIQCDFDEYCTTVKVIDDGPGIDPQYHNQVQEMFQTLKPRDEVEGSGMGLAITSRVMENLGGSLNIESDGVNGTKIIISWPNKK